MWWCVHACARVCVFVCVCALVSHVQVPFSPQNMLNRRSFSDVLPESPKSARKKEEARQAEFVRIGQVTHTGTDNIQSSTVTLFISCTHHTLSCSLSVVQALKLKTIVRGDAPTSLVTTGLCRKEVRRPTDTHTHTHSAPCTRG